jgi:hypothetical protein
MVVAGLVTFATLVYTLLSFRGFGRGLKELCTSSIVIRSIFEERMIANADHLLARRRP